MLTEWAGTPKDAFDFMAKDFYNINPLCEHDTFP